MTREEMIKKLNTVEFNIFSPPDEWEDIGFTEREIWVNSKGYGYIACDEPTAWWCCSEICDEKWNSIRRKLENRTLTLKDIEGTSLMDMVGDFFCGEVDEEDEKLCDILNGFNDLPEKRFDKLFCMDTFDDFLFFTNEEDFRKAYERDWCDYTWDELDNESLACWIDRIFSGEIEPWF